MECKRPSEFATDATSITCKSQALLFTATRLVWLHLLHVSHKHICFQLYQLVWLFTNILLSWTDHPPQEPLWREDSPRLPCVQWHWPRQLGILWHGLLKTQQRRVFNQTIRWLWHGLLKKGGFSRRDDPLAYSMWYWSDPYTLAMVFCRLHRHTQFHSVRIKPHILVSYLH